MKYTDDMKRLASVFHGMKTRCYYTKFKYYYRYGGRGITICDEWLLNKKSFFDWALSNDYAPGLEIDRVDNDKGYSPENCRWVTRKQNLRNINRNAYITFKGKRVLLIELCEKYLINYGCLYSFVISRKKLHGLDEKIERLATINLRKRLNESYNFHQIVLEND